MKTLTEFSTIVLRRAAAARTTRAAEGLEPDALVAALAGDLSLNEDRVRRLIEALDIAGPNLDKVRLVRVFQGEKGPLGAVSVGEFHYVVDRAAAPERRGRRDDRGGDRGGDRRDRGGDRGGGGGGGGGGSFGGPKRDKPRGLGSLVAAANKEPGERKEDDRARPGEVPRAGIGWQLTAAPRDPRDNRERGRGRGGPRRDRDDRGRGRGPGGGGPGGDRGPRGPRPPGQEAGGPGGGPRPDGDRGDRRPRGGRGRGGRGRGPGGGGGGPRPDVQVQAQPSGAPVQETATEVTPPVSNDPQTSGS